MSLFEMLLLMGAGFAAGSVLVFAIIWAKYGGWLKLPQNTTLVLSVDRDGYGKLWEVKKVLDRGFVQIPGGKGYIQIDKQSGIWLPNPRVKLFLHYADYFRTIPPKHGAFFTHFKGKRHEVESAKPSEYDAIERQEENQPSQGVMFNIADVMHWVKEITPGQLLEGVITSAMMHSGLKKLVEEGEGIGGGWLKWLLIAMLAGGGIFFVMMLLPK